MAQVPLDGASQSGNLAVQQDEAFTKLRILCLDGDGFGGSLLMNLKQLKAQIVRRNGGASKRPCDYFDLICGTGTGGLIAIMLGRLKLDIDTVLQGYAKIQKAITTYEKDLEKDIGEVLIEILSDGVFPEDIQVDDTSNFCRTFVLAVRPEGLQKAPVRLRSYGTRDSDAFNAKISQIAYAILATRGVIPSLKINDSCYAEASDWNNPMLEAMNEANDIWPEQQVKIFSIGAENNSAAGLFRTSELIHEQVISVWETYAKKGWEWERFSTRHKQDKKVIQGLIKLSGSCEGITSDEDTLAKFMALHTLCKQQMKNEEAWFRAISQRFSELLGVSDFNLKNQLMRGIETWNLNYTQSVLMKNLAEVVTLEKVKVMPNITN